MIVLKMNYHSAEIRIKRPDLLSRFTAPELCQQIGQKERQNKNRTNKKTMKKQKHKKEIKYTSKQMCD